MTAVHFLHSTLQQCHRLNTFANLLCAVFRIFYQNFYFRISQQKAKFWTKAAKNPGAGYTVISFPRLRVPFTIIRRGDSDQSFDGRQCLIFRHLNVTHCLCLLAFLQDQSVIKKWALFLGECSVCMKYSTTQEINLHQPCLS